MALASMPNFAVKIVLVIVTLYTVCTAVLYHTSFAKVLQHQFVKSIMAHVHCLIMEA